MANKKKEAESSLVRFLKEGSKTNNKNESSSKSDKKASMNNSQTPGNGAQAIHEDATNPSKVNNE